MDNKVIIEITETGWVTTLNLNGETYQQIHTATPNGFKCVSGNFGDVEMDDDLRDSLHGFANYDIMRALNKI